VITVMAAEDNVKPGRFDRPADGRYMVVDWLVKNEGTVAVDLNRLDFKLQTGEGYVLQRASAVVREPDLATAKIGAGQFMRGWLTYEVPNGARATFAIYQPSGTRQVIIADLTK